MPISFEIHPTIGIARLGTSDRFFVGPEPDQAPPASYRDAGGILRQAARFRIFQVERDPSGRILSAQEVGPDQAEIEWTTHLANRKGTARTLTSAKERRNHATGHDQADLGVIIDPGARSVSAKATRAAFDTGTFGGEPVPLGEIRFEVSTGRLIVLGGRGHSGFVPLPIPGADAFETPLHFADNDQWFDDSSEGPVTATLRLKTTGEQPEVTGARVIVGPPDFAPDIQNFVTLYDIVYQVALDAGLVRRPATLSFMRFVHPILMRASGYQWVNAAAFRGHGGSAPADFEARMASLADPEASPVQRRTRIFNLLRQPGADKSTSFPPMPRLLSEEGYPDGRRALALTRIQYEAMEKWATQGADSLEFAWDSPANPWIEQSLPDALDRVALEACAGGGFYPGIEAPRFIRDKKNYESTLPVRLKESLSAGSVNAQSAVPWQADFYACQWETTRDETTGLETLEAETDYGWWPAQRPDSVFTDPTLATRVPWAQGITSEREMVDGWHSRKFVLRTTNDLGRTVYVLEP